LPAVTAFSAPGRVMSTKHFSVTSEVMVESVGFSRVNRRQIPNSNSYRLWGLIGPQ
jgi:hypothetical protein